jgi:dolichol-phosphate mannosyltransferase
VRLSIVIPAHDEEGSIAQTVRTLTDRLRAEAIAHEILVIDDGSHDRTGEIVAGIAEHDPNVRVHRSPYPNGFGFAVRAGLERFEGDAVAIMMADLSDSPDDVVAYHRMLERGFDCAFGSRFMPGGSIVDYPRYKLVLNRIVNQAIRLLFRHGYDDTTNAFKAYRREVVEAIQPLLSNHFNLTVELPLKSIVRGHSYAIVPISWRNRQDGVSKLRLQEMGSRYLFIILYVWLEHMLSRGDYVRPGAVVHRRARFRPGVKREAGTEARDTVGHRR